MIKILLLKKVIIILSIILGSSQVYGQQNPQIEIIDVLSYSFDLELNNKTDVIEGHAMISMLFKKKTNHFFLELSNEFQGIGMVVSSVLINDEPFNFLHADDKISIKKSSGWNRSDTLNMQVYYSGIPGDGLIISENKFGTRSFFGDNWPNRAHNYLPVIDHPSDKARIEFIITCPEAYEVIASGKLQSVVKLPGKKKKHHFKTMLEFPTKVAVFAATNFKVTEYDTIYGTPISSWIYEENKTGFNDYYFATKAFRFFSDTIGPYIFEKLANVQSKTRYGGMENAGNIFYSEHTVNGNEEFEALIVHEVAHHWFGNAATENDWHHIWLSEGFATYLTDLYWEHFYGLDALKKRMNEERTKVLNYSKSVPSPVVDFRIRNWMQLLNPNSYQKGAWILHMLRQKTGDEIFYKILQSYFDRFKYGNAISSDFQRIAEEMYGSKLDQFFMQWLYFSGNPDLEVNWFAEDSVMYVHIKQIQSTLPFHFDLEVESNDVVYSLQIARENEYFIIPCNQNDPGIKIDPNVHLLHDAVKFNRPFEIKGNPFVTIEIQPPRTLNKKPAGNPILIKPEQQSLLKPGDLLFQDLDCGPLCDAIESVTLGYKGADFSHVALVTKVFEDSVLVFEAIGGVVQETTLDNFLKRSHDKNGNSKVMVGRIQDQEILSRAIIEAKKYAGKAYDDVFDINNDSYYCSELLYFSFLDAESRPIFDLFPMTFKRPDSENFDPAWISYYRDLGEEIPEGRPGLNPGGISRSTHVKIIYKFGDPDGYRPN